MTPEIAPSLASALGEAVRLCSLFQDDWWIIGSAAVALSGVPGLQVPDIDVLCSGRDAHAFFASRTCVRPALLPSDRFQSVFGRYTEAALPVEIMGDLKVSDGKRWRAVRPVDRVAIPVPGGTVYIPSVRDQIKILELFGREKDAERATMLKGLDKPASQ